MKKYILTLCLACCCIAATQAAQPWDNGRLKVSDNQRYLVHEDGAPFFWLGNTAWLISERLNRDEVEYYLTREREAGYNVEQIQVLNAIPTFNIYGHQANDASFNFSKFTIPGVYTATGSTSTTSLTSPLRRASTSPWTASGVRRLNG